MPAYNAEKTISEAIESVIGQTYKNWELIIINDGSTDHTINILEQFVARDKRIMVISTSNQGVSSARNQGIIVAKSKWIAFLDSDDQWESDKLKRQIEVIKQDSTIDLVFTGSAFIDQVGRKLSYYLSVPTEITYNKLLKQNIISCSSVMVKRELLLRYQMKCDDMHEDYAVWLSLLKNGYRAYGINAPLLIYRLSPYSKSGDKRKAAIMTYRVYRRQGLNCLQIIYYFSWYAWKSFTKYKALKNRDND